MTRLRVGIIGTGRKKERPDAMGFAMAYAHADAYQSLSDQCELVACADIVPENAEAFARATGIPPEGVFTDYKKMLAESNLDLVSICTWPHLHAPMVIDCAQAQVRAIHCEKPMADSWGAARLMAQECERRGVQLTINHQRRFGGPFRKAKALLTSGEIGDLQRIEIACSNLFDWGTHYIDMAGFYSGDQPAEWVIGQIDYRTQNFVFGAHIENQAIGQWRYTNGVYGFIATGLGEAMLGADNRLIGTDGIIEVAVHPNSPGAKPYTRDPLLRMKRRGSSQWETVDTDNEDLHSFAYIGRGLADAIDALQTGREPELSARHALNATEIIFAIYESSRRRGRVDLPLKIHDHPLVTMVQSGDLHPEARS